jgi:hypothetical protein
MKFPIRGTAYLPEKIGFVCVVIFATILNCETFVYDEPYYLENVALLFQHGFGKDYLNLLKGPAGPTHSLVHFIMSPVTQMRFLAVRLVNPLLFLVTTWMLNRTFNQLKVEPVGWRGVAVPMTAVCVGMALTEMPAVFFLTASIYLLTKPAIKSLKTGYMLLAGMMFSLAIMGRQPVLLVLPFLVLMNGLKKENLAGNCLFIIASLAFPAYCFFVWGNIIPNQGAVQGVKGGLVFIHFLFALGYCLLTMLLISPGFLKSPFRIEWWVVVLAVLALFLVAFQTNQQYPILNTLAQRVLPESIHKFYPYFGFALILAAGLYFAGILAYRIYEYRNDKVMLGSLLACAAILFSALSISHQFSSRYVFQAYPFLLIISQQYVSDSLRERLLRTAGILLGLASLVTYVY